MKDSFTPRVRIAPSPTGYLHIGTARTALFNYLFAKHNQGKFILRIEDTDQERSKKEYEKDLLAGLKWLGLDWDEEITYQSQRTKIYQKYLKKLLKEKKAYYCYCTKERLEKLKKIQALHKQAPHYDSQCKNFTDSPSDKKWQTIRFDTKKYFQDNQIDKIKYYDLIHGETEFKAGVFDDFVIANQSGVLYNFANVIDDHLMQITHIIRGEDHISNTPKQIMLYSAFGWKPPKFAHLPLILNPDRSKMSKRAGDTHLQDYIDKGYLAEALINFLVFLGWNPKTTKELFNKEELIENFGLKSVHKAGAVFNLDKLDWFNAQYIKNLNNEEYLKRAKKYLGKNLETKTEEKRLNMMLLLVKSRLKKLIEIPDLIQFFFKLPQYKAELLIWKDTDIQKIKQALEIGERELKKIPENQFQQIQLEPLLKTIVEKNNLTNGEFFWPLRTALSGLAQSPSPFEILEALGKGESLKRIQKAIQKIK